MAWGCTYYFKGDLYKETIREMKMLTKRINGSFGEFQKEKDNNDLTDRLQH